MKELLIRLLNLHFVERKKYSEVWQNDHYTMIWNLPHGYAKIRNRGQKKVDEREKNTTILKPNDYDRKSKSDLRCSNDGGFIG